MLTDNILDLIGRTPLIRLKKEPIFAKAEFLNPGGSIKDRAALAMIEGAERDGRLRPDSIIVEPRIAGGHFLRCERVGGAANRQEDRGQHYHRAAGSRGALLQHGVDMRPAEHCCSNGFTVEESAAAPVYSSAGHAA